FFSSRRRHTRFSRDWSSDVCSSDLHNTEGMRQVVGDAMDIHGGRGVIMGPSNYLARNYQAIPISITVEGANILTRSMIIFGQGAIRCHPYLLREVEAASNPDHAQGVRQF